MTKHNRRKEYWQYYELAKVRERTYMKEMLLQSYMRTRVHVQKAADAVDLWNTPRQKWVLPAYG